MLTLGLGVTKNGGRDKYKFRGLLDSFGCLTHIAPCELKEHVLFEAKHVVQEHVDLTDSSHDPTRIAIYGALVKFPS